MRTMRYSALALALLTIMPATAMAVGIDITATADNYYTLYVDGVNAIHVPRGTTPQDWKTPETRQISLGLGTHVLAVKAENFEPWSGQNPAGFLAQLAADAGTRFADTGAGLLVSDESWLLSVNPQAQQGLEWYYPQYDDSSWGSAFEIGSNGVSPWGTVGGIDSSAQWIWSPNWKGGALRADSPVYLRRTFTLVSDLPTAPVPEPLTMVTVGSAVAGLAGYIRRRRKM